MGMTERDSAAVIAWWTAISGVSVINMLLWLFEVRRLRPRPRPLLPDQRPLRRAQAALSAAFVLVCAFRSFLPRAEPLRTCLVDGWLSSAALGRAGATVAELSFVAQWALLLAGWANQLGADRARLAARVLVPMIAMAEVCSWYATLTTNALGSVFEESLWTVAAALLWLALRQLGERVQGGRRRFVGMALVLTTVYVLFMCFVDVPMYVARWRADERAGRTYLSLRAGWRDAAFRRVVTRRWKDWRGEMPWMSLYFSAGVWLSIALIRAPRLDDPDVVSATPWTAAGPH